MYEYARAQRALTMAGAEARAASTMEHALAGIASVRICWPHAEAKLEACPRHHCQYGRSRRGHMPQVAKPYVCHTNHR